MHLSNDQIEAFQTIYKNSFGKEISREDTHARGIQLVRLMQIIYRSISEMDCAKSQQHNQKVNDS